MQEPEPIWARPERAARGPRPAHSRDEVAAAAVALADAEGIEAVSMRRVAAVLGTGTTSLYRYLAGKDELLDLMVNAVAARAAPPGGTGDWRTDLRTLAIHTRARLLRHPWLPAVAAARPNLGPATLRWTEAWLAALDGRGLNADALLQAVVTVQTYVSGSAQAQLARRATDFDAWMTAHSSWGDEIMASGRYPALTRVMRDAASPRLPDRLERAFTFGLESVLDGIAALLTPAGAGAS